MKKRHGGRRLGAGRKLKFGQRTSVIRLPIDLIKELKKLSAEDLDKITVQLHEFNNRKFDSKQR